MSAVAGGSPLAVQWPERVALAELRSSHQMWDVSVREAGQRALHGVIVLEGVEATLVGRRDEAVHAVGDIDAWAARVGCHWVRQDGWFPASCLACGGSLPAWEPQDARIWSVGDDLRERSR